MPHGTTGIFSRRSQLFVGGPTEGFLQHFHVAARVIALPVLLLGIALCHNIAALSGCFIVVVLIAVFSYLNPISIYKLLIVPILLMALPSWFAAALWYNIPIQAGSLFFMRTLVGVTVASVMLHSIGLRRMSEAFEWLRVPRELRLGWTMALSQIAAFSELIGDMMSAGTARRVKRQRGALVRRQTGTQIGILFARMWLRGNQLAMAMDARNIDDTHSQFSGTEKLAWSGADYSLIVMAVVVATGGAMA